MHYYYRFCITYTGSTLKLQFCGRRLRSIYTRYSAICYSHRIVANQLPTGLTPVSYTLTVSIVVVDDGGNGFYLVDGEDRLLWWKMIMNSISGEGSYIHNARSIRARISQHFRSASCSHTKLNNMRCC